MRKFNIIIKEIRKSKGYTQQFMADRLNISQQMYAKYEIENRNITVETLIKIAEILEVTPNDLIDFFKAQHDFIDEIK